MFDCLFKQRDIEDTLVVTSKKTGKSIEIPVRKGSIKANEFKKMKILNENGLTYVVLDHTNHTTPTLYSVSMIQGTQTQRAVNLE